MKTIKRSTNSPAGRTVCAMASALNRDPEDVLQGIGILFGICNRRSRESTPCTTTFPATTCWLHNSTRCPR